ncbi:MAG: TonB family protein [Pseudomonadota bacterium]
MSYATTARRPNPLAAIGALGVPATFGAILVVGLAVTQVIKPAIPNPVGESIPDVVITPEIIEPEVPAAANNTSTSPTQVPVPTYSRPDSDFDFELGTTGPIETPGGGDTGPLIGSGGLGVTLPPIEPLLDPVAATPRGDPGNWITTADYKTSWIRRDFAGTARFTLQVDALGRVGGCTITGSTGHEALDRATCRLLEARAIFNPAKGSDGNAVAGTYSSSVNWSIPE